MHKKRSKKSQKKKSRGIVGRAKAGMEGVGRGSADVATDLASMFGAMSVNAVNVARDTAQAATTMAQAALPEGPAGPLVVMSARSRGPRGASSRSRSHRDVMMPQRGTRSSSRVGKKTKKYSPPKPTVSASRKAAAKKANATRKKNMKSKTAKRRAAAIKGANTRRANDLSNLFTGFGL